MIATATDALRDLASIPVPDLSDPAVAEFAEQFRIDVSAVDDGQRAAFFAATAANAFVVTQQIYVHDMLPRLRTVLATVAGIELPSDPPDDVANPWPRIEAFMAAVARLHALDAPLAEMVRLRGARLHDCAVCKSRRNRDAIDAGATEGQFAAVDDWHHSDLPERTKAALALVDAMVLTPQDVPRSTCDAARRHLRQDEIEEVLLDVVRNAANKIAVALGADAATVTDGVELFTTDIDGNVVVLS